MSKVESSWGSPKNFKKSLLCPKKSQKVMLYINTKGTPGRKNSKSHFYVRNLWVGARCGTFCSKRFFNMCHMVETAGWEPDAVRLQHKIQHLSHGWGSRVGARCGIFSKLVSRCCGRFQKVWSRRSTLLGSGCGAIYFWKLKDQLPKTKCRGGTLLAVWVQAVISCRMVSNCTSLAMERSRCRTFVHCGVSREKYSNHTIPFCPSLPANSICFQLCGRDCTRYILKYGCLETSAIKSNFI